MRSLDDGWRATIASYERGAGFFSRSSEDRAFATELYSRFTELSPGRTALDLGCGPAHDGAQLARRGFSVTGCDPTKGLLSEGRGHELIRGRLVIGDARRAPFSPGCFDAIWACASLLHIPKPEIGGALAEAIRILRTGGLLFTSMQEGRADGPVSVGLSDPLPGRQYFYYRAEEWLAAVEGAGFELIDQHLKRTTDHVSPGATGWIETFARKPL
jgi:SAM-dependent methyltransferase